MKRQNHRKLVRRLENVLDFFTICTGNYLYNIELGKDETNLSNTRAHKI